jgi:hypothetical protein
MKTNLHLKLRRVTVSKIILTQINADITVINTDARYLYEYHVAITTSNYSLSVNCRTWSNLKHKLHGFEYGLQNTKNFLELRTRILKKVLDPAVTQPLTEMSTRNRKRKCFWGVASGRRVRLWSSPLSVSRLSRQYGILNISQPCKPRQHVTGIALLFTFTLIVNGSKLTTQQWPPLPPHEDCSKSTVTWSFLSNKC